MSSLPPRSSPTMQGAYLQRDRPHLHVLAGPVYENGAKRPGQVDVGSDPCAVSLAALKMPPGALLTCGPKASQRQGAVQPHPAAKPRPTMLGKPKLAI